MKKMHIYVALGISIGVLAGLLCLIVDICAMLNMPAIKIAAWPGFVAWACYFAIGGKPEGMIKVMSANTVGIIMGGIIIALTGVLAGIGIPSGSFNVALAIAVLIGAFILCVEAFWPPLSFIPGAFCGCACSFGAGAFFDNIPAVIALILSMLLGAFLAWLSDIWGQSMAKSE